MDLVEDCNIVSMGNKKPFTTSRQVKNTLEEVGQSPDCAKI